MNVYPSKGYLLVEPIKADIKEGELSIPQASEQLKAAKVIAINDAPSLNDNGVKVDPPCKVEDSILHKPWGGNEVKVGARTYLLLRFEDVIARIEL